MAILVPLDDLEEGAYDAIRQSIAKQLRSLAASKLSSTEDQVTVRDVDMEEDFSQTDEEWNWSITTANTYVDMLGATFTVPTDKFFAIYSADLLTNGCGMQKIRFTQGGNTTDIWSLRKLLARDHPCGVTRKPIVATSQTPLQFAFYGSTVQTEEVVIGILTAEKRGRLITEKSFGG